MSEVLLFFFNDTATTEIYTLSLHDALPIFVRARGGAFQDRLHERAEALNVEVYPLRPVRDPELASRRQDRKSTRLNSSHANISYAVFCLKKKKSRSLDQQRHRRTTRRLPRS